MRVIIVTLIMLLVLAQPVLAAAGEPPVIPIQSTPVAIQVAAHDGSFPWAALVVLLAPLVFMVYKSRGKKEPNLKSCA